MREPMPEAPQRRRIPARLIIMAWVTLLMATVLALVNLVTWTALTAKADERVDRTLSQEIGEFQEFAEVGVDPKTGQQFTDVGELVRVHLEHRFPDKTQILFGWVEEGAAAPGGVGGAGRETGESEHARPGQGPLLGLSGDPAATQG